MRKASPKRKGFSLRFGFPDTEINTESLQTGRNTLLSKSAYQTQWRGEYKLKAYNIQKLTLSDQMFPVLYHRKILKSLTPLRHVYTMISSHHCKEVVIITIQINAYIEKCRAQFWERTLFKLLLKMSNNGCIKATGISLLTSDSALDKWVLSYESHI